MILHLLLGLLTILIGAEFFTNAIEWLGNKLRLSEGVVGNLLAAVGTALPESIVPMVAFCSGSPDAAHIGIGAILGAPFMLGTLAMFITGFCALLFSWRKEGCRRLQVDTAHVLRDLRFFIMMYTLVLVAAFLPLPGAQQVIACLLLMGYGAYAYMTIKGGSALAGENLKPLYLSFRRTPPRLIWVVLQLALGLLAIVGGANFFVAGIDQMADIFHIQPLILALMIAPIATELPEKFNSVIWIAQKKDALAMGNITGAMVFQSTLIPAFGMMAVPWILDGPSLLSSFFLLASVVALYVNIRRQGAVSPLALMGGGVAYASFLATIFWCVL